MVIVNRHNCARSALVTCSAGRWPLWGAALDDGGLEQENHDLMSRCNLRLQRRSLILGTVPSFGPSYGPAAQSLGLASLLPLT